MSRFNPKVWASAPTTFGWRVGKSGEPPQARFQLGNIVPGVFTPVLAKHSKSFSLIDCISVGVDRMQRNFEPMRKQVEAWQRSELTDVTACKAETAETMPILGTSSPEPYEWSGYRYCCHNSYVPVVWAYPSSVTGKARNPLPSGKLFRVRQMIAPPAMRDLPNHLASEIEFHSVAGRRHVRPACLKSSSRLPTSTTFPILPVRSVFDGGPPRSDCSAVHMGAQHPASTVSDP